MLPSSQEDVRRCLCEWTSAPAKRLRGADEDRSTWTSAGTYRAPIGTYRAPPHGWHLSGVRQAVATAGGAGEGVRLIESPRDLRSVLEQATLALAPMRCGAGFPIKVLEAWACGVPVVAFPWAVAGTSGRQGEDFRVVGQHPIEWVSAILELLDDPAQRQRLADSGRRRLAADYSRETVRGQLLEVIDSLQPAR
jgi:glycosyltransferase involved in cell wall biosynthesis